MKRTARLVLVTSLAGCLSLTIGHAQYYPNRAAVNPYTGKPLATQAVNPYTGNPASPPGVRNPYTGNVTPAPSGYNPLTGKMQPGLGSQPPAGGGQAQWPRGDVPVTGKAGAGLEPFDRAMLDILNRHGIPGAALAIARNGKLIYARGFGWADLANGTPVQPSTPFGLASLSKPITALATLLLVERAGCPWTPGRWTSWRTSGRRGAPASIRGCGGSPSASCSTTRGAGTARSAATRSPGPPRSPGPCASPCRSPTRSSSPS